MSTKMKMSDEAAAAAFEDFDPDTAKRVERSELDAVEEAVRARREAEEKVEAAVREARAAGLPWTAIAVGLGVSHQAAIKRYAAKV